MGNGVVIKLDASRRRHHQLRIARKRAQSLIKGSAGKKQAGRTVLRMHPGGNVLVQASRRGIELHVRKLPRRRI